MHWLLLNVFNPVDWTLESVIWRLNCIWRFSSITTNKFNRITKHFKWLSIALNTLYSSLSLNTLFTFCMLRFFSSSFIFFFLPPLSNWVSLKTWHNTQMVMIFIAPSIFCTPFLATKYTSRELNSTNHHTQEPFKRFEQILLHSTNKTN